MQAIILVILIVISPVITADDLLDEISKVISEQHIDKPTKQDFSMVIPDAVNDYLQTIDPYSKYLTATEYEQLKDNSYVGIGAKLITSEQGVLIVPFYQGPAFNAGINKPMLLQSVNGISIKAMDISKVLNLFKENDKIVLETLVDTMPRISTITRQPYVLPSVQVVNSNITYIRINKFIARETTAELKKVIKNNFVIDLRESTGGDFYETLDSLSLFLPPEKLLATTINNKGETRNYYSIHNQHIIGKVILLIGPRTASSAEIFAKALQYYQHAVLVGQKTYGKCVSQTYIELEDGSALKLTNLKIFYPDGTFCNGEGLIPDILLDDKQLYEPFDNKSFLAVYKSLIKRR